MGLLRRKGVMLMATTASMFIVMTTNLAIAWKMASFTSPAFLSSRAMIRLPIQLPLRIRGGAATEPSPCIDEPPEWPASKRALILIDVFSEYHGMYLAHRAKESYGVAIIPVLSDYMQGYLKDHGGPLPLDKTQLHDLEARGMPSDDTKKDWVASLPDDLELVAVICESDSGLADSERLGVLLNLSKQNGVNDARRNKYKMMECLREAGIPVVQQRLCSTVEEAVSFATKLGVGVAENSTTACVVKPIRGVASDDVFGCNDLEAVGHAFQKIHGSQIFDTPWQKHDTVLIQEFAVGQEFAIDVVSRDGEHKVAAVWIYDKRPANNRSFVYFATKLYDGDLTQPIFEYTKQCLDALGVRWGLTHTEIIQTSDGPRLVEVNCRQHNMDFLPIVMGCIGYNALDMLLASYLEISDATMEPPQTDNLRLDWVSLPEIPSLRMHGAMVHLVSHADGSLTKVNDEALMQIQKMQSTVDLEVYGEFLCLGNAISPTVDIRSDAGWVQLVHPDNGTFEADYNRIIELMPALFSVNED